MGSSADPLRVDATVLANGLEVARQAPPPAAASFAVTYLAPAGWAYDPAGREGLAEMVALTMISAAGRRDRVALARYLDALGATLRRRVAPESIEVRVSGPAAALPSLLEVLADVVHRPRFDGSDIERVTRQIAEVQLREAAQPGERAERELLRRIFPEGHPYRLTGIGTRRSVRRIGRRDIVRFHREHCTAEGAQIVLTGRPGLDSLAREVRRRFPDFARERAPPTPAAPPLPRRSANVQRLPMPGRSQVDVRIGGPSVARSHPLYPELYLANEVLGGRSLLSRLFQRVRERAGLAYHASSEIESMRWGGYWMAQAGTGPERTDAALRLMTSEIARVRDEAIPERELRRIRESSIGELPLALETAAGAHELALDVAYHHLGPEFLRTWPRTLRAITPGAIRRAVPEGLDPASASTVLAGPLR